MVRQYLDALGFGIISWRTELFEYGFVFGYRIERFAEVVEMGSGQLSIKSPPIFHRVNHVC